MHLYASRQLLLQYLPGLVLVMLQRYSVSLVVVVFFVVVTVLLHVCYLALVDNQQLVMQQDILVMC
jgi:hypothetical protein